ncbi:hypothetical protein FDB92_17145, partial [Clostridium butyricum]|nr:hypothetical protein [Clostridium butyricum]NFS20228.1 hypothetical protein [Clostridium butyricum]
MANKIQIRRGKKANLPTLSAGEPAFCTDTNQLFVGNGASNIEYAKQSDVSAINTKVTNNTAQLNDITNSGYFDISKDAKGADYKTIKSNGFYRNVTGTPTVGT